MLILRYGKKKLDWFTNLTYKMSFYNIIKTGKNFSAIYNSASGAVVLIENDTLNNVSFSFEEEKALIENGFMVPDGFNEFENYYSQLEFGLKKNTNFFTIIPTTCCNAKCFYCYEETYSKQSINSKTHSLIVDYLASKIQNQQEFVLDWYGGEPLLCIEEIDNIIDDLSKKIDLTQKHWISSITTNATLFDEKTVMHARDNWHLESAYITIDGTEKEHNARKKVISSESSAFKKTYNAILLLLNSGVYVNLRIHLDNQNRESFFDITKEIEEFFKFDNFHLFPTYLFPPEFIMEKSYIRDSEKENLFYDVFKVLNNSIYKPTIIDSFPWPKTQNCFATKKNTIIIAPDGSLHSCVQEFLHNDENCNDKFCDYSKYCIECSNCKYFPICLGGCIHNHSLKESVRTPCVRNRYVVNPLLELLIEDLEINK